MKNYEVVIIGCGASGVMAALKTKQKSVAVIDAFSKPAKKLLVTGNGRCNLTNKNIDKTFYNANLKTYFERVSQFETLKFFNSLGLETFFDEEGRCYPISNSAKSVVDVLSASLNKKADLFLDNKVEDIEVVSGGFVVKTDKEVFNCKKLVIATGGNSLNAILNKLNLKYKSYTPSLVALKSKDVKDLNGIKVSDVLVTASNKTETKTEKGEVLFKDGGLSGIVIFNLSTIFARNSNFDGTIKIDLLPNITESELAKKLEDRKSLNVNLDKFFVGFFQNALANEIFKQTKINTNINSLNLTKEQLLKLTKTIKNLTFKVDGCFDNNQVFSGGISLNDLDENLMSKQIKNLYFAGEICDVDGACGGYNLQWAWTSGQIVGESL